jgi:hypothetical protein
MVCSVLVLEAGLRIGEAFGLKWGDVWEGQSEQDTQPAGFRRCFTRKPIFRTSCQNAT